MAEPTGYDIVIVGGGSAGAVLAARLSESGARRVLLLEAGGRELPPEVHMPQAWPALFESSVDWGTSTVPQSFTGSPARWVRGKGLGGSSLVNAMTFLRGSERSYAAWAASGVSDWSFADLLPFFRRSEHASGRDPGLRGQEGPMRVAPASPVNPWAAAVADAAAVIGLPRPADVSGGREQGVGPSDMTIVDGRRLSVADAYLAPAEGRADLEVRTGALVRRILVEGGRAVAVEWEEDGHQREAALRPGGEVLLSAGCVGSPQLLMLSGIGPADHLREQGIPVLRDLPGVGENFHDHPMAGITWSARQPLPPSEYQHSEVHGLIRSGSRPGSELQVLSVDVPWMPPGATAPEHGYNINVALMTPRSRGSVRLASADPHDAPLVDPAYLSEREDVDAMVAGLRLVREIGSAADLAPWNDGEVLPGPQAIDDDALVDHLRAVVGPYWHGAGSCAMGTGSRAVVDGRLRVHGVEGLRVVDASIMPSVVSGNTNATVIAIAERAADFLVDGS